MRVMAPTAPTNVKMWTHAGMLAKALAHARHIKTHTHTHTHTSQIRLLNGWRKNNLPSALFADVLWHRHLCRTSKSLLRQNIDLSPLHRNPTTLELHASVFIATALLHEKGEQICESTHASPLMYNCVCNNTFTWALKNTWAARPRASCRGASL